MRSNISNKPRVLFFDSGIGGLSILQATDQMLHYQLDYFYCADNSWFPYSNKDPQLLIAHLLELIPKLLAHYQIDLLVLACNTATLLAVKQLRQIINIPIVAVEPALKPASILAQQLAAQQQTVPTVGILATVNSINNQHTKDMIKLYLDDYVVLPYGSTQLVEYAEAQVLQQPSNLKLDDILEPWLKQPPQVIILGCTHFPLIKEQLSQLFSKSYLVDPNLGVSRRLAHLLKLEEISTIDNIQSYKTFITTQPHGFNQPALDTLAGYGFKEFQVFQQ